MINLLIIALIVFLAIMLYIAIFEFFASITKYFDAKTENEKNKFAKQSSNNFNNVSTFIESTEASVKFLTLCQTLIDVEISRLISKISRINTKYDTKNIDNDIREISEKVFNGFDKERAILSHQTLLSDEYIINYIVNETTHRLITATQQYNISWAQSSVLNEHII